MSKLRIVSRNTLARAATLVASTTSGGLAASNLLTDLKSQVWRATGATATLTATWAAGETIACAILPHCNLSPTATIRVQLYDATTLGNLLLDTNILQPGALACPAPAVALEGWTPAAASSAYAHGGGAYARIWFAPTAGVRRMVITITDPANLQGYLEATRLIAGPYWQSQYGASGASMTTMDDAEITYSGAGDQMATAKPTRRRVPVDLALVEAADRTALVNILRNSRAIPILISVFPGNADLELERDHMVYGRRSDDSDMAIQYAGAYATKIDVIEV